MSRIEDINRVYGLLEDEDSRRVFDAKIMYGIHNDDHFFLDAINEKQKISLPGFDSFYANLNKPPLIIYGSGHDGRFAKKLLEKAGYSVSSFCSSDAVSKTSGGGGRCQVDGLDVITFEELCKRKKECAVLVASRTWYRDIYIKLIGSGFSYNQIYLPLWYADYLVGTVPHQYFDFFKPREKEIFVDCGAYDGMTTVEFYQWAAGAYSGSYIFEPSKENESLIRKNLADNNINKFEICMKGVWDIDCDLPFSDGVNPGKAIGNGDGLAGMTTIDNVLQGREATYIKMDVEGSESKALMGAKETIAKWKPRLAICVYHKPEDFIDLPLQIAEMNLGYHFAMRHYMTLFWETVLYAWV